MKQDSSNSPVVVSDKLPAALITRDEYREVLMLFAERPRTLVEVAGSEHRAIKRLHHQVRRLCAAGLMEVVGERPRAGRSMKLYQGVGRSFFVPNELLPIPITAGLLAELRESQVRHGFLPGSGIHLCLSEQGRQKVTRVEPEESSPAVIDLWIAARLAPRDVVALKAKLRDIILHYRDNSGPGAKPYLIHAAAAPRLSSEP